MWKDYSSSYIKNNRASSISITVAALICALFLSFLCSLFYNLWVYDVERVVLEEGDWQGRITGELTDDDLLIINQFGSIRQAVVNEELSGAGNNQELVVDLYFHNPRTIYRDLPLLTAQLGIEEQAASYHSLLLSNYLIHDPQAESTPLLLTFYLVVLLMVSCSLILIIRNSFSVSMHARIHQFGIFSSIGATPRQIKTCLMQEAFALCTVPIVLGTFLGTALSAGVSHLMERIAADMPGRQELIFRHHPLVLVVTICISFATVLFSAWLPARKLSRLTPLQAIRTPGTLQLRKKGRSRILPLLFGIEGELAGNALRAQKKALRTSTISLTLSFLGFTLLLCFFTLSGISTRYTYFERYQDVWDVMVTVKDTKIEEFELAERLNELIQEHAEGERLSSGGGNSGGGKTIGGSDVIVYQRSDALCRIPKKAISRELTALGGPQAIAGSSVTEVSETNDAWLINAPIVVLDDTGFAEYCQQIGVTPRLDGTIILNRIWDRLNSNFRYPSYIPYVDGCNKTVLLQNKTPGSQVEELPVIAYTMDVPVLKEEYENYALVQFIPLSLWKTVAAQLGGRGSSTAPDTYIRILTEKTSEKDVNPAGLETLERSVVQLLSRNYSVESENRIQEKVTNDRLIWGYQIILGGFCALLALIGIANVFSNTLGFLRQRRREFAQYRSVGITPESIRKIFCIEALVIAGRPIVITLPLTAAATAYLIAASHLRPAEFLAEAPFLPIAIFGLVILGFVALAYYLGGRKIMRCNLADALKDDTAG